MSVPRFTMQPLGPFCSCKMLCSMLVETQAGTIEGLKPRSSWLWPVSSVARVSLALPAGAAGGIAEGWG